jgi:hypothetical protein
MMTGGKKPPKRIKQRDPNAKNPALVMFKGLFTLTLIAITGLMLWPQASTGKKGTAADTARYRGKINLSEQAVKRKGHQRTVLTEQEINGHFATIVKDQGPGSGAIPIAIEELSTDIKKDTIIAYLNQKVWVIHLTYQFEMKPHAGEHGFDPEIVSAHLGHMPLVSVVKLFVVNRFKKTLTNLSQEQGIMRQMRRIQITEDKIAFEVNEAP